MRSTVNKNRKQLIELGSEVLADALLGLASYNQDADGLIARLTAGNDEKVKRFKSRLATFKHMDFVDWRKISAFARELASMLSDLKEANPEPRKGVELIASFYEVDADIFDNSDDDGVIGNVFCEDAASLFAHFAADCKDKDWLLELVLSLNMDNGYGVRDALFERVGEFLPADQLKKLIDKLWALSADAKDRSRRYEWLSALKSVARSTNDAELFEAVCRARDSGLSGEDHLDIAELHFKSGNAMEALTWVERAPKDSAAGRLQLAELTSSIHQKLGNKSKVKELAWQEFNDYRSKETLTDLLSAIGKDKRKEVVAEATKAILKTKQFSSTDAEFLLEFSSIDEAEKYLLKHASELDGNYYSALLPLAQAMKKHKRYYIATIIYRKLLNSILERGQSKAYEHGADYLQKLKTMTKKIADWQTIESHDEYIEKLKETHKRKTSFWIAAE